MKKYKPDSYNSVSPYLVADEAQRLVDFIVGVFDGRQLRTYNRPDGSIMHTEVRIDDSILMISDSTVEWPATVTMLHVYVSDVDATFKRALDLGGKLMMEPSMKGDDPDKRGMFEDFAGNQWAVSTQMEVS